MPVPLTILVSAAVLLFTHAGPVAAQPLPALQEYHVRVFTSSDGLAQADVRGVAQLPDGQLYVAGGRGLLRYDGYDFHAVELEGSASRFIEWLHPDGHGRLWLFFRGGGGGYYDGGRFRIVEDLGRVSGWFHATPAAIWFRDERGLVRIPADTPRHVVHVNEAEEPRDIPGRLVAATTAGDSRIALEDLVAGEMDGAARVSATGFHFTSHQPIAGVDDVSQYVPFLMFGARDGTRWLTLRRANTENDLLLRWRGRRLEVVPLPEPTRPVAIQYVTEDHEGSLWLATNRGLVQLVERRVHALTTAHGLAEPFTAPVLQTRDGDLWVGTWGGGLHRFADGRLVTRYTRADGLPENRIRSLHEDADGALWVGTNGGVAVLRGGRITRVLPATEVRGFARTPDGTMWVATTTGLMRAVAGRLVMHRPDWRHLWTVHAARDGSLWAGGEQGLHRIRGDSVRTYTAEDGLRSTFIVAIHEEPDGTLWFSTYEHGMHRFRDGRFAVLTAADGLHHDGVWRMLADDDGHMWLSGDFGISRLPHHALHAAADAVERGVAPVRLTPLVFTEAHGMPSRESNRASPAGWRLHDGRLVFNSIAGLAIIDPARALNLPAAPRILLRSVTVDGAQVTVAPGRRLRAGLRHLTIDFGAVTFLAPDQIHYRYRLEGHDADWVDNGSHRRVTYSRLPPGHYTFRVQSRNGAGAWSEPGAVWAFVVPPLLWQAGWFRLLALLALTTLLAAAYRYRVRRLLELQRLRLSIAADLHDDVGSNLSSIALLSEMLRTRAGADELQQRQLTRIGQAAEEAIDSLRDIVWVVDPKHGTVGDLVARMRQIADDLLPDVHCTFTAGDMHTTQWPGMAFLRSILLSYKEALHNVARHARAAHVRIDVRVDAGDFIFIVEDDGVGFDTAGIRAGRGLGNLQRRAAQVHGAVNVSSHAGGTRVEFRAPLGTS